LTRADGEYLHARFVSDIMSFDSPNKADIRSVRQTPVAVVQFLGIRPTLHMNRFVTILLLSLSVFLTGCAKPDVKYSDLSPATTATVSGDTVTIHLGSNLMASACWTRPKVRVDGQTVYVAGYRTVKERSREFVVHLPASAVSQSVSVVWIDPDGSRVTVPIKK